MGLAALWVVLYHSGIPFTGKDGPGMAHFLYILNYYIHLFKTHGQIGVEIFLFLSAVGLYFSFEKDDDIRSFYFRRMKRIMPEYLLVNVFRALWRRKTFLRFLDDVSGFSFIKDGYRGNWFFILLFFLYLIYPFLHRVVFGRKDRKALILLLVFPVLVNLFVSRFFPVLFDHTEIALRRIPVFLAGLFFAKDIKDGKKVSASVVLLVSMGGLLMLSRFLAEDLSQQHVLYRYVCGACALLIIFLLSFFYDLFRDRIKPFITIIEKAGDHSMEFYLLFEDLVMIVGLLLSDPVLIALIAFIVTCLISPFLKKLCQVKAAP